MQSERVNAEAERSSRGLRISWHYYADISLFFKYKFASCALKNYGIIMVG